MRRPIVFIFFAFICGIELQYFAKLKLLYLVLIIVLIVAFLILAILNERLMGQKKFLSLFLLVLIIGSLYLNIAENQHDPLEKLKGKIVIVYGRVLTIEEKNENYYKLLISRESGKRLVSVKGNIENPAEYIGRVIQIKGEVELPTGRRNPGLFDYQLYLKTKGVKIIISSTIDEIDIIYKDTNYLLNSLAFIKYKFIDKLERVVNPNAYGLLVGMLFGDRNYMSDDIYESFQSNGIAHILSVSGIHVGIIYLYINKILKGRRNLILNYTSILILIAYAALAEFSPSVVRAVVMIIIHIISKLSFQRYDFTTCASASALFMLLVNPYYLFNTGFQLSYMAVFCLAVLLPWSNRKIKRIEEINKYEHFVKVFKLIAPLCVIQIGMAPLTSYIFNYFSIAAFFINLPVIALSGVIIPIGICLIPVVFINEAIFGVGATAVELIINFMLWLNKLFYLPGIGFFNTVSPSIGMLVLFYSLLFLLTSEYAGILYQRKKYKEIIGLISVIIITSLLITIVMDSEIHKAELIFLDVGQGDCLHIRTPRGKNILIDGGGSNHYNVGQKTLLPYLLKNRVKSIDLAIVSHLHDDHYLGIVQLSHELEIKKLGTYEANKYLEDQILTETGINKDDVVYLTRGQRIHIEKDIWIDIIFPDKYSDSEYIEMIKEEKDENKSSLLIKISYMGLNILMTGDIGFDGEKQIMELYKDKPELLSAQVLKIGHHGSRYSTSNEFLEAVNPKVAVFQVGKNNFGHPHPTVIEKCKNHSIIIFRNDLDGAVIFDFKPQEVKWQIRTQLQKNMHINKSKNI